MIESITLDNMTIIISELAEGGALLDLVRKSLPPKPVIKQIMIEIMEGLVYLHSREIIHHDIKLENILLTKNGTIKICDFGLSSLQTPITSTIHASLSRQKTSNVVGSLHYIPPELLLPSSSPPTALVDIWATGCCLYALIKGVLPFSDTFLPRLQMTIVSGRYEEVEDCDWARILEGMLCGVERRWNSKKVLEEILKI